MASADAEAFTYDGGTVAPGETQHLRYTVSQTYLGDAVRIPVTVVNGVESGPTLFLSAAAHGDELNGVEVVREVADGWDHETVRGTLVCLPVLNVPGFTFQERYLPIYDRDLNRAFPGSPDSTSAKRMAHQIFRNFVAPCDVGLDFHTSTRGRSNLVHVRADVDRPPVSRLARAFGTNLVIAGEGPSGSLRREASEAGVPTVTVEMGEAHRFQRDLIDRALEGVANVAAEYGIRGGDAVDWPGWRAVVRDDEKTWLRADVGGMVEVHYDEGEVVPEGEAVCTITDPFKQGATTVDAPFDGLLVSTLENPVVYPGNPVCHLAELDAATLAAYRAAA